MSKLQEIKIPDIGTSDKVDVIEVLVKVGDKLEKEDPILTLESEKASMDVPTPEAGIVKSIEIKVGDKVAEGDLVLTLEAEGDAKETKTDKSTNDEENSAKEKTTTKTESSKDSKASNSKQVIYIPDLGTDAEVDVIEMTASVGDSLQEDSPIATLESDKASMDVPSPVSGKLLNLFIKVGDKVKTGDKLAEMEVSGGTAPAAPKPQETKTEKASTHKTTKDTPEAGDELADTNDLYAGPAVRRLAREIGVDLNKVKGTGRKGRIQLEDVHGYVKPIIEKVQSGQLSSGGLSLPDVPKIDHSKFGEVEELALSKIQKISGPALQRNWVMVPHVTQFDEADITDLEAFRKEQNKEYKPQGIKITPLAFIMKAVTAALQEFPKFNASLSPEADKLIMKKYFHIGVAVDTPNGLVVAVVRDVDKKDIVTISKELTEISNKARTKGLSLKEMQGSSFTISSLGGIGGTAFTPIVNLPDVAILGVSRSQIKPVYQDEQFVPRLMLPLSLSYDHRVIDGADGARFTSFLSKTLSDIRTLIM